MARTQDNRGWRKRQWPEPGTWREIGGRECVLCYVGCMKQRNTKPSPYLVTSTIVLGRSAFKKMSAVEGISLSQKSESMFAEFDRQGLSADERRRILLEKHAKKA